MVRDAIFLLISYRTSTRPGGKETKVIVQQTARETTAIMQLMANKCAFSCDHHCARQYLEIPTGTQWRQDLRKWFSSPDPSTNHIISCGAQHEGTAIWFFRGSLFEEWKSTGSLLWIHGKRTSSDPYMFLSNQTCPCSGRREEYSLVCRFSCVSFRVV